MSHSNDMLDLRDLANDWRALDLEDDADLIAADTYAHLCAELGIDTTPDALEDYGDSYEPTLIHEDYFTEYAEELADDIGAIDKDARWPLNHIDWEAAADELKIDYTSVTFDGDTYYIRAC